MSRVLHRFFEDLRVRLENLRSGEGLQETLGRVVTRRRAFALAAVLGSLAIGVLGYAVGTSQVDDADTAYEAGAEAGERRGTELGARQGYRSTYRRARERAFDAAYLDAYRLAYREAFDEAGLAAPRSVRVSGP